MAQVEHEEKKMARSDVTCHRRDSRGPFLLVEEVATQIVGDPVAVYAAIVQHDRVQCGRDAQQQLEHLCLGDAADL